MAYTPSQRKLKKLVVKIGRRDVDHLKRRQDLANLIAQKAENGVVMVVESGRDCDGVQYWGCTQMIPASVMAFIGLENHTAMWAEGPFSLQIERPSMEREIDSGSRDLVMEAFEDGHPHVIYC